MLCEDDLFDNGVAVTSFDRALRDHSADLSGSSAAAAAAASTARRRDRRAAVGSLGEDERTAEPMVVGAAASGGGASPAEPGPSKWERVKPQSRPTPQQQQQWQEPALAAVESQQWLHPEYVRGQQQQGEEHAVQLRQLQQQLEEQQQQLQQQQWQQAKAKAPLRSPGPAMFAAPTAGAASPVGSQQAWPRSPSVGLPAGGATHLASQPDDPLSGLLLSWYNAGYQTGLYQAMAEMGQLAGAPRAPGNPAGVPR